MRLTDSLAKVEDVASAPSCEGASLLKSLTNHSQDIEKAGDALEDVLLNYPQVECPVIHRFGPGLYIREVKVPSGTIAVGHKQKFEQMNVFLKGRVTVLDEDGTTTELKAPMIFTGKPGRKIGYVHEDMVWLNIYPTEETDVEALEDTFLDKTERALSAKEIDKLNLLTGGGLSDFEEMLKELGVSAQTVRAQSETKTDMIPLPHGSYKVKVSDSPIEGKGLFATADIEPGEIIAPARIGLNRTIAGRYANHSKDPNAKMVRAGGTDINLQAIKSIAGCRGGLDGEEITIDYRDSVKTNLEIGGPACPE